MKNLLFVSVALSVFTVTSLNSSAQAIAKSSFPGDVFLNGEGITYLPLEAGRKSQDQPAEFAMAAEKTITPSSVVQFKYASLLKRDVAALGNLPLFNFIDEWWGTRYRFGGSTKKGIDCSSFTGLLMNSVFGISLPRTARAQYAVSAHLRRDEMSEGDLVFFNTRGGVSHVGVYLGDGYFVHSSCSAGVTISNLDEPYYNKRFIAGGRALPNDCMQKNNLPAEVCFTAIYF